jgi:hypothetical protein
MASGTDIDGESWNTAPSMGCDEYTGTLTGPIHMSFYGPTPIRILSAGDYDALFDGQISKTIINFGHGTPLTNSVGTLHHFWPGPTPQNYEVILTAFNEDYPLGTSFTQTVEVVDSASDIYVRYDGNNANAGHSWTNAKQTIQGGVDGQNVCNGKILVDGERYIAATPILINKPVHLIGTDSGDIHGGGNIVIVDGRGTTRCFDIAAVSCKLKNFIIQNGAASTLGSGDNKGGGIRCKTTDPVIQNTTFKNCTAFYGGAVQNGTLSNCVLSNNVATSHGGAIRGSIVWNSTITSNSATRYGGGVSDAWLANCTLSTNTAKHGGATYNSTLSNCVLVANSATTDAGAAYSSTLDSCNITSNTAPSAGGLYNSTAIRCVISTNNATLHDGGGIYKGTAHNCTIYRNRATEKGGGSYNTTLRNCTVADNGAFNTGGSYGGYIYNSIIWNNFAWTNALNVAGTTPRSSCYPEADPNNNYYHNITNNPQFVSYPAGFLSRGSDYYLGKFSPCLNAGENNQVKTVRDFNGWNRIIYSTVDIGACEMWFGNTDTDGDDMPDGWELENFGGITNAVAAGDADSDQSDNRTEYIAGTDPHDVDSYLHLISIQITKTSPYIDVLLKWEPSVEGRTYGISSTTNLLESFQDRGVSAPYPNTGTIIHTAKPNEFYKVNVRLNN